MSAVKQLVCPCCNKPVIEQWLWRTKDGKLMKPSEMTITHIWNVLQMYTPYITRQWATWGGVDNMDMDYEEIEDENPDYEEGMADALLSELKSRNQSEQETLKQYIARSREK